MPELVLGPLLRYVDETQATVWVQADEPCEVEVLGHRSSTFEVDGHHFALVIVRGLSPGTVTPYEVRLGGRTAWPPAGGDLPPSVVRTPGEGADALRLVFGSCREVAPHEAPYALADDADDCGHGIDALRTYALERAGRPQSELPDALLMLGDQLYADEPPRHLAGVLRTRDARPAGEVRAVSFADYATLYRISWEEPAVRWLLSTVPSVMIFDDHEIVDEWKFSQSWVDERRGRPEYERRVTAGLMAYWVFQHLGNLSPAQLAGDEVVREVADGGDAAPLLREVAAGADRHVGCSRWSFCRDLGRVRLLVLDSRAARRLEPGNRRIIDDMEWEWAVARARERADVDHLLLATSLPVFLPAGIHHLEAALERLADGGRGMRFARGAEWLRRALNLGHWGSFQISFHRFMALLEELTAAGRRAAPASVLLLSGDVHHGYLARWRPRGGDPPVPVWQIVCSPFRKRQGRYEVAAMRAGASRAAPPLGRAIARLAGVPRRRADWQLCRRPVRHNQIATLELAGRRASVRQQTPDGSHWRAPLLRTLWERRLA